MRILIEKEDSLEHSSVGSDKGLSLFVSCKLLKDQMLEAVLTPEMLSSYK